MLLIFALIKTVFVVSIVCFVLFVALFILGVKAQERARKRGSRAHIDWWIWGRHLDWIRYHVIGPIKCLFKGHDVCQIFMWSMSSPASNYCQGHCRRCLSVFNVQAPSYREEELIPYLYTKYKDCYIVHLGTHGWGINASSYPYRDDVLLDVSCNGDIIEERKESYGTVGHIKCFFVKYKAKRD